MNIKSLIKSKNFAAIPLILFVLSPVFQTIHNIFVPSIEWLDLNGNYNYSYAPLIDVVNGISLFFGLIALVLYIVEFRRNGESLKLFLKENKFIVIFAFLIFWMVLAQAVNGFDEYALDGTNYVNESIFTFIENYLIYFFCAFILKDKRLREAIAYLLIISGFALGLLGILSWNLLSIRFYNIGTGMCGVFYHFNYYGYYLAVVTALSAVVFSKEKVFAKKIICLVSYIINMAVLIVNNTFGSYLAVFFAIVLLFAAEIMINKKITAEDIIVLAIFILITFAMSFEYDTVMSSIIGIFSATSDLIEDGESHGGDSGRITLWTHSLQYIMEQPIFGYGIEGIDNRLYTETGGACNRSHNEVLIYGVTFGAPAAIAFVGGYMAVFLKDLKLRKHLDKIGLAAMCAAFSYVVSSMFGNTVSYTAPFFFIVLGLCANVTVAEADTDANTATEITPDITADTIAEK